MEPKKDWNLDLIALLKVRGGQRGNLGIELKICINRMRLKKEERERGRM